MIDWGYTVAIVITGIVVVFVLLFLLVIVCECMGKFFEAKENKSNKKDEKAKPVTEKPAPAKVTTPIVSDTEDQGVIAAISAAITAIFSSEGNKKPFAIKSIKRSKDQRSTWGAAGIIDNTRQF